MAYFFVEESIMIKKYVVGPIQENCYVVIHGKNCIVIDPGSEADYLIEEIEKENLKVLGIFITHGHYDHIGAVNELREHFHTTVYASHDTKEMMMNADENLSIMIGGEEYLVKGQIEELDISDSGVRNKIEDFDMIVYSTPGHAKGSCLFYLEEDHALFTGDTLFMNGCGRIDFPTGNQSQMIKSLIRIKKLDFDADVYPGHGPNTTLYNEKNNNPYLNIK